MSLITVIRKRHWVVWSVLGTYAYGCAPLTDGGTLELSTDGSSGEGGSSGSSGEGGSAVTQSGGPTGDAGANANQGGDDSPPSLGGSGGEAGTVGEAGAGGAALVLPDCESYCTAIIENCLPSNVLQYSSRKQCLAMCAQFPIGTLDDTSGNTLGCRLHYANLAAADSNCYAAGPLGVDVCGSKCDGYCTQMMGLCPTGFASVGACKTDCSSVDDLTTTYAVPTHAVQCGKESDSITARMFEVGVRSTGTGGAASAACERAQAPCGSGVGGAE